ncbi:MAG: hypothetical protein ACT4NL_03050 [Pseudomarimonas sp.]
MRYWLWVLATAVWLLAGIAVFHGAPVILDEGAHGLQVMRHFEGNPDPQPGLTTFSFWHALLARLSGPWLVAGEQPDVPMLRLWSVLFTAWLIPAGYWLVRASGGSTLEAARRSFGLAMLPGVAPLLFLLYTDIVALVPLLVAAAAAMARRPVLALVGAVLSTLVRQTSVVWVGWLALRELRAGAGQPLRTRVVRLLPHALALAAFGAFVLCNGGIAIGDRDSHPTGRITPHNLMFALLYAWIVLLPLQLAAVPRIVAGLRARPLLGLPLLATALLFWFGFAPDHPYNQIAPEAILHNGFIAWLANSGPRALGLVAITWSLATLQFTALRDPQPLALHVAMVLSLLPVWMVEPRYALPALALFFLLRREENDAVELALACWLALLGLGLSWGYAIYRYLL